LGKRNYIGSNGVIVPEVSPWAVGPNGIVATRLEHFGTELPNPMAFILTVLFEAVAGEHRSRAARRQHLCRPAHRQCGSDPRQRGVWKGTVGFLARTTADLSAFQSVVTIPLMLLEGAGREITAIERYAANIPSV